MDNDNVIDFGKWTLPKSWDELTLKQFQEIEKYYSDKDKKFDVRDVLEVFTDHSRDEIDQLPISFVNKLLEELIWLEEKPTIGEPCCWVDIDGIIYSINVMNKLKTGEFISIDTILKSDPYDYASIFAVICRRDGEIYDSKFEAEVFDDRVKLMGSQPMVKMMPLIAFFLDLYVASKTLSLLYSEVEEGLNHIQQSIDNSERIGVFRRRYLNLRMKKLRKLLESNKSI